ncbi:hypothetical protein BJV82DRAFT_514289 [Fennellomyces sp. T-0311]|nr:hypothetical protein BJV82DRAFT_514289 [Fennellomyces sp. T-0311]
MSKEESKQLIQLSASTWSIDQKKAIARIVGEALTILEPIVHPTWGRQCWSDLLEYLELSQQDLVSSPMAYDQAADLLSSGSRDIRIEILVDLLALSMHLNKQPDSHDNVVYDARARRFLFEVAHLARLNPTDVTAVERSVAQQMYFALQENTGEKDPHLYDRAALMDQSAQKKIEETNKQKKTFRWLATGAGVLGGGALIAITGGLAAPLLAPLLAGLTGAAFFATAGGVALMTSLFGLTGKHNKDEFRTPWERGFSRAKNYNDIYCLQFESDELMDLGLAFDKFVRNQAIRYAGVEVAKQTALRAFFSDVLDNPWQIAADRARKAGVELYERKKFGLVDHVVLMGAPISGEDAQAWKNNLSVVSGRCVNCFTEKDWVLAFVYRLHSLDTEVAGLQPVKHVSRLENVRLELEGHTHYRDAVEDILTSIGMA